MLATACSLVVELWLGSGLESGQWLCWRIIYYFSASLCRKQSGEHANTSGSKISAVQSGWQLMCCARSNEWIFPPLKGNETPHYDDSDRLLLLHLRHPTFILKVLEMRSVQIFSTD